MSGLYKLTVLESAAKARAGEIKPLELVEASLARIKATEAETHACLSVLADEARGEAAALEKTGPRPEQKLWGVPVTIEDLFCTKAIATTAASKMLEKFRPSYDSHVVSKLRQAGAIIVAKTNLDEFGLGTSTELSAFGPTRNPWNKTRVPGGSAGGSAASVAACQAPASVASDSGGSARQPACLCGCVGLKPSYGRVSSYGMMAFGSSFDQAAFMARRVADCALLLEAVAGVDEHDNICSLRPVEQYSQAKPLELKGLTLGLPAELWDVNLEPELKKLLDKSLETLRRSGVQLRELSLPTVRYAVAAYYVMACAEASTNMARFDGLRYGFRAKGAADLLELYVKSRSQSLGLEIKRRILLGTFALSSGYYDAYYKKAAQLRRLIYDDYARALQDCDFLITPVSTRLAWELGSSVDDPLTAYQMGLTTLPESLTGLPALALPLGLEEASGLPAGFQLIGRPFEEMGLVAAGLALEELFPPLL